MRASPLSTLRTVVHSHGHRCPAGRCRLLPPDEGAGRVGCAVGSSCASLRWLMRVSHAPRERPFFPARVHWSCCDSPGTEPRGLSSKPCAGAVVQGFVTEPPWTLRLRPGGNAVRVRFALQPMTGLQLLHCWATPQSQLASSPGSPDLAVMGPDALTATPAAALSSRSSGRPRNLPQTGRGPFSLRFRGGG